MCCLHEGICIALLYLFDTELYFLVFACLAVHFLSLGLTSIQCGTIKRIMESETLLIEGPLQLLMTIGYSTVLAGWLSAPFSKPPIYESRLGNACCCLITRAWHPCWKSLACLVRFHRLQNMSWHFAVSDDEIQNCAPTPYCIHNTKEFTHDSLYMRVIVNVIFYVGGYGIVLHSYSCCFTESVIYIYIFLHMNICLIICLHFSL